MELTKISDKAKIGENLSMGEFSIINDDVVIGNNCEIGNHVVIENGARIADNVKIGHGTIIGGVPQDLKFEGEMTTVEIGEGTTIREYTTINRGTKHSGTTKVGKNCFIMSYVHVAHDCVIGDNVIIANAVNMAGHVEIDDQVFVGGLVALHQFIKLGKHIMIGAACKAVKDIPPYILAGSEPLKYEGVNIVGLRRKGFTNEQIGNIRDAYDTIYRSGLNVSDAVKKIKSEMQMTDEVNEILKFIENSNRGILRG
ncbi:MAG: acyl-ACP--UDP-N-acetylglucosamine O-acyltransferase [Ignavibacteriae bacterium]|nr:acyl-ACP--UDP-N-acetylglucosamine O-acyltransferase [Ignavibacteriota bacterium]